MGNGNHDTKGNIRMRGFLSFVLFLLLSILSVSICGKAVFLNTSYIEDKLSGYEYTTAYAEDVLQYASDAFVKNGIDDSGLEEIITYDDAQSIANTYINSVVKAKDGYTSEMVAGYISELQETIKTEIKAQLANTDYKYDKSAAESLAQEIGSYANDRLTIPHSQYLETVTNLGGVAFTIILALSVFFSVAVALILYFIGAKRYRSVRAIGVSFAAAGFFNLILSLIVVIISNVKIVDIFPLYLRQALMSYVNGSIKSVALSGGILLLIALSIITGVWKMKRSGK